jgi:peptide deformylase
MREIYPEHENPVLRNHAAPIPLEMIQSPETQALIKEMKKLLLKEEYGVARAAQDEDDESEPVPLPDQVYINPELTNVSRKKTDKHEGCLSVRGKWGMVPRYEKATVRAYDEQGRRFTRGASGFLAHIFQHEMDHLDGILYTDKAVELYDDDKKRE